MSTVTFPPNPVDGMLFEAVPGLVYKYSAGTNCWIRIEGLESLNLATPLADGLMSKEDFQKLQDLIIPPIRSTLTGEDCGDTVFGSGVVDLQSDDRSIEITDSPNVINKVGGQTVGGPKPWELHENTVGFDFTVPLERLVQRIEGAGLLSRVQIQGRQGPRGETGDSGIDRLDTGPVGSEGQAGANSPFGGTLTTEPVPLERVGQENRAIVDIATEETDAGSFLVVTRANIGNPDACPTLVIPKEMQSSLMVVLNELDPKLVRNENVVSGDCALICRICASTLHHLDIDPILEDVFNQYRLRLQRLKLAKESLVRFWLQAMVSLFNEQKAALCCALENCRSRQRNERTRQYIETQRIQAANGGFRLNISSDEEDQVKVDMDNFKDCPVPVAPDTSITTIPGGVQFVLDSRVHIVDPRNGNTAQSLKTFLPAGDYIVTITDCCANFNQSVAGNQYSGRVALLYQGQDGSNEPIATEAVTFPNFGNFNNEQEARSTYNGLTLSFSHAGGDISAWLLDPDGYVENNAGTVTITIVDDSTLVEATNPSDPGIVYVYRNEVALDTLIGSITPYFAGVSAEENLGLDTDNNINLVSGPYLGNTLVSTFFYNGTDGFSVFFVAGNNPQFNTAGMNENDTEAVIQVRILITNNTVPADVRVAKGDVTKISNSEFIATLPINGDAAGFALGEIDAASDYSITVVPTDLSTMTVWRAQGPAESLLLAESDETGIGTGSTVVRQGGTVSIFDITSVPEEFAGPEGLEFDNGLGGQDVYIGRPIDITVVNERPLDVEDPRDVPVPEDGDDPRDVPDTDIPTTPDDPPGITIVPEDIPPSVPPQPEKPVSPSVCEIDTSLVSTPTPTGVTTTGGTLVPTPAAPAAPVPSTTVVAQDPCIIDVVATARPSGFTSIRYVFTDDLGIKYYSAFVTIPANQALIGQWSEISLGPPVKSIAPPDEFTTAIISTQNLDLSTVSAQLTTVQRQEAESLEGLARLTYVQELLGSPISSLADTNNMVNFEIQVQRMGLNQAVAFGELVAIVGTIGNTLEYTIDNFVITQDGTPTINEAPVLGRTKRVVATVNSSAAYQDLVHYWGDYTGFDLTWNRGIDFNGNQFFTLNKVNSTRIVHVKYNESSQFSFFGNISSNQNQPFQATQSGVVNSNALAVDYYGVLYTVDAQQGRVLAYFSTNAQILNTTHGDANGGQANAGANAFAQGFPTSGLPAKITPGRMKMSGPNIVQEMIVNFNGTWWAIDGAAAVLLRNSPAARIDTTTARCCGNPGNARAIALSSFTGNRRLIGNSSAGNSIATDRPLQPQPTLPVPSSRINQPIVEASDAELNANFNDFNLYCLEDDGKIYLVDQSNGSRTLFRDVGEPAFGLKCNPRTKDLYYIPADRRGFSDDYPSGTRIKRVDIDDINMETGLPRIKTVWIRDDETEGVFSIEFANTVPADPTRSQNALYALVSTATIPDAVSSNVTRVIEIAELPAQLNPGPDLTRQPTNGAWVGSGTGGVNPGGPGSNGNPIVFSRVPPGAGCQMFHRQVEWYERGWRIGACCGALVELNGVHWLVVKRSIGIDLTCGGGESENTPCIRQYIDAGEGHPAIAWPTAPVPIDPPEPGNGGEEFLGRPTSGFVNFVKDDTLSGELLGLIRGGAADRTIGNPGTEIPFILFPSI